jgi:VWFA-related protein
MFRRHQLLCLMTFILISVAAANTYGQHSAPTPTPESKPEIAPDSLEIFTEEVQIPVFAYDEQHRPDSTLEVDDLLLLEDGSPQRIRSLRRVPSSVLIVLDTGGEINPVKNVRLTREVARSLVSQLRPGDEIALMQFHDRVEVISQWTTDTKQIIHALDTKLISGRRAFFSEAISTASQMLQSRPVGSRHLVLITDGVETTSLKIGRAEALKRIVATNTSVHILSYTTLGIEATTQKRRLTRRGVVSKNSEYIDLMLPSEPGYNILRQAATKPSWITIDLDPARRRRIKAYEEQMQSGEVQLARLAEETGGRLWLPLTVDEMLAQSALVARWIDTQYLVTYTPLRPLTSAPDGEFRRIDVVSRRASLRLNARRGYRITRPARQGQPNIQERPRRVRVLN